MLQNQVLVKLRLKHSQLLAKLVAVLAWLVLFLELYLLLTLLLIQEVKAINS
jgi:hypothetical protein